MSSEVPQRGERVLSFSEIVLALGRRGFFLNLLPYFLVLIPFIVGLNLLAWRLDARLGLPPLLDTPARAVGFCVFTCAGVAIVWWSYAYLCVLGEGSPSPHLGGTQRLVRSGPYSVVRHPSVIGKLCGVIGAGCIFASPSFLLGMLPVLFSYSLLYNRFYQELWCVRQFGEDYLEYRRSVPFIIPSPRRLGGLVGIPANAQWLGAWALACVLMVQCWQLWWLTGRGLEPRYVYVPLGFRSTGGVTAPRERLADGPLVVGPTITIEDVVRGLLVMEEQPQRGLSLQPLQRQEIARLIDDAARARDEMLETARAADDETARQRETIDRMLGVLTEEQRRFLRDTPPSPAAGETSPWNVLIRVLEAGAR